MSTQFPQLFSPMRIGRLEVRNRIVFQAHRTNFKWMDDGNNGQRYTAYQEARARGGVGLIILEDMPIHLATEFIEDIVPTTEIMVEKYRRMANAIHKHGASVIAQMVHHGRENVTQGPIAPWGFSALPAFEDGQIPHQMTVAEIREVSDAFGRRAGTLKSTGVDGVEIHATHGGLIQQSWSPVTNIRQDEYGGNFERRVRFATEVLRTTRDALGPDLVLGIRVSGDDFTEGGVGTQDIIEICRVLVATGTLDYINVTAGARSQHYAVAIGGTYVPPAVLVPYAAAFKEAFPGMTIGTTCRIKDPAEADAIVGRAQADMIGMTRALIADPDLPLKAKAGDVRSIRECISCKQGCIERSASAKRMICTQNAEVGWEYLGGFQPAIARKRVLVVGGGPAGLEAARVAAERGHEVILCEASDDIGGQIRIAAKAPTRDEFDAIVRYRRHELERLGVTVRLNTRVDAGLTRSLKPDAIVVATGALPSKPPIPGIDRPHVLTAWEALSGEKPIGNRVAQIDLQGEHESMSVADCLLERGKQLQVVTPLFTICHPLFAGHQQFMTQRLLSRGARYVTNASVVAIGKNSLEVCRNDSPSERWIIEDIDTVVLTTGYRANDGLVEELEGIAPEIYCCGDASAPRRALQAVPDGYRVGAML